MSALRNRPRLRRLNQLIARQTTAAPSAESPVDTSPPSPPEPPAKDPAWFLRGLRPQALAQEQGPVSRILYERLNEHDIAATEELLEGDAEASAYLHQAVTPGGRRHIVLTFGVWLRAPAVLEKTGLSTDQPPEDVHSMARGPLAAAGGIYEADLVTNALESAGLDLESVNSGLDFGCSSGRVVRVMAAAYPNAQWHACDPNQAAIEWADAAVPKINFFTNGDEPPLAMEAASLDMAYAISIWSHFAPELGLRWFEEMHRLIRPGGHLVFTTHGLTAVDFYVARELRTTAQSEEIVQAVYSDGWWYAAEFGEAGDWGVVNPDWGTTFMSPEWLLTHLCPQWRVVEFAPGRNAENQDVYVLQRA